MSLQGPVLVFKLWIWSLPKPVGKGQEGEAQKWDPRHMVPGLNSKTSKSCRTIVGRSSVRSFALWCKPQGWLDLPCTTWQFSSPGLPSRDLARPAAASSTILLKSHLFICPFAAVLQSSGVHKNLLHVTLLCGWSHTQYWNESGCGLVKWETVIYLHWIFGCRNCSVSFTIK